MIALGGKPGGREPRDLAAGCYQPSRGNRQSNAIFFGISFCKSEGKRMIYDVIITRDYRVEAPSEEDALIEALRLEETEATMWPVKIDMRERDARSVSDLGSRNPLP